MSSGRPLNIAPKNDADLDSTQQINNNTWILGQKIKGYGVGLIDLLTKTANYLFRVNGRVQRAFLG